MDKQSILAQISFGHRVAEDEADALERYFVETDHWRRLFQGTIDIVYGAKGSGKSALYSLLSLRRDQLFDRATILVPAENPRGATAFAGLVADPPTTEVEFKALWKLYFACITSSALDEYGVGGDEALELRHLLARDGMAPYGKGLRAILRAAFDYVKGAIRPESVSATVEVNPNTGLPTGFGGRITFQEPPGPAASQGYRSVENLLGLANRALERAGFSIWIILDRLDVAFVESPQLEQNALRALFHVYRDFSEWANTGLRVFLRTDIWRRITAEGFREASHITRTTTISWDRQSILNLIVSRAVQNQAIQQAYLITPEGVLKDIAAQETFFYRIFPRQVDVGPNKPRTLEWIIGRTKDGSGSTAPREVIHLLNSLRETQVRALEIGENEPDGESLFSRTSFKPALAEVSRARLEQTFYAEYPSLKPYLEKLRGEKATQKSDTLSSLWRTGVEETTPLAQRLVDAGFFEVRGSRDDPEYRVPFLYRDALDLVQGSAARVDVDDDV